MITWTGITTCFDVSLMLIQTNCWVKHSNGWRFGMPLHSCDITVMVLQSDCPWACFSIKMVLPDIGIPIIKIRWPWHLIFIMGIFIPGKMSLYCHGFLQKKEIVIICWWKWCMLYLQYIVSYIIGRYFFCGRNRISSYDIWYNIPHI